MQPREGGRKPEAPSRKGEHDVDVLLQDGEHEDNTPPQGSLNEGQVEPDFAPREALHREKSSPPGY